MAITWSEIRRWDPANLNTAVEDLTNSRKKLMEEADEAASAKGRVQSSGAAVTAMLTSLGSLNELLDAIVNEVSELIMATAEAATGVWDVKTKVFKCTSFLEQCPDLSIGEDGQVTGPFSDAMDKDHLEKLIKKAIERAVEVDNDYAKRLRAVANGRYVCKETAASDSQGLPDLPQKGWSPTEAAAWWGALTGAERRKLIKNHPEAIGNLDGLPGSVRDEANRIILRTILPKKLEAAKKHLKEVQKEFDAEQKIIDGINSGPKGKNSHTDAVLEARRRVEDLTKLNELVSAGGKSRHHYQLLTLEVPERYDKDVKAVVAVGDIDKATNVGTMVPGIGNTVRKGMDGMLDTAEKLRAKAGAPDKTAVVAWLGYDTPPGPLVWDYDANGSDTDYMTTEVADKAAPALNRFQEGIHVSHQKQGVDPYLSLHGHSYGSTLSGTALLNTKVGVVDAAQLHGSPGGRATNAHQWNVPYGHMYAAANGDDDILGKGQLNGFGPEPSKVPGVQKISSDPDGGHSDYWSNPEFMEDAAQIMAGEDPSVDRSDNAAEASAQCAAKDPNGAQGASGPRLRPAGTGWGS